MSIVVPLDRRSGRRRRTRRKKKGLEMSKQEIQAPGRFVWHELMTKDVKTARNFYTELLGWKTKEVEMGELGKYTMLSAGDIDIGGLVPLDSDRGPSRWLGYIGVPNVDAIVDRAQSRGSKLE